MTRINVPAIVFSLFLVLGCAKESAKLPAPALIPEPLHQQTLEGVFSLTDGLTISTDSTLGPTASYLSAWINKAAGWEWPVTDNKGSAVRFIQDTRIPSEGYELIIDPNGISIHALDRTGAFYAVQTLRQLLPDKLEKGPTGTQGLGSVELASVIIKDAPRFPYRGMHLDVGRHFFPPEFVKEYISWLAMLKFNRFHWHLTEDQGWRIEIEKYPRLASHAAWRDSTLIGHYSDFPRRFDKTPYGGYYTKDEIRSIVSFADSLNVQIIPEIEMPGHAQAAISAYPELGCRKSVVPVASTWGIFDEIYCPTEQTFTFLKEVLDEVIALFPGKYIHIGGDEAPKMNWKACGHCQQLIARHQLQDESGLQSWFITQIEAYVNSKGRSIIGWDEILDGGLAPNATVMSWRGMEGGVEAARSGHDVIMTPTSHAYFDYYQSEHPDEPLAIGGYLPLKKVYSFNPVPKELNPEEARHILGGQGNIWTEYMPTAEQVEYMAFPRMLAMAEVLWSAPRHEPDSSFVDFAKRVANFEKRLGYLDINTNKTALYRINSEVVRDRSEVRLKLSTLLPGQSIRYRVNMGPELAYSKPILLDSTMVVRSFVAENGRSKSRMNTDSIMIHKGIRASLKLNKPPHPSYDAGGVGALNNGRFGNDHRFGDSEWLGFWGEDIDIEMAFEQAEEVRVVRMRSYHAPGQWVYAPVRAVLTAELTDGSFHNTTASFQPTGNGPVTYLFDLSSFQSKLNEPSKIVTLRINIPNFGVIPEGRQGAGNKAWTFIDEIAIE